MSSWTSHPPLRLLSAVWLALCTFLVGRRPELLSVFFSFVGCFAAAATASASRGLLRSRAKDGGESGKTAGFGGDVFLKNNAAEENAEIRDTVGLLACALALLALLAGAGADAGAIFPYSASSYFYSSDGAEEECAEAAALSVLSGYLAFDLWCSPICHPPPVGADIPHCRGCPHPERVCGGPSVSPVGEAASRIVEDALTLSVFVVALTRDRDGLRDLGAVASAWVTYKCARLVRALSKSSRGGVGPDIGAPVLDLDNCRSGRKKVASALLGDHLEGALREKSAGGKAGIAETACPPQSKSRLWTIHGVEYDFSDFVSRHPGGEQAILLGRDRDCTALFESYHPFTKRHQMVMGRYASERGESSGEGERAMRRCSDATERSWERKRSDGIIHEAEGEGSGVDSHRDPFYEVLKERAARALREGGIDPILGRGATPIRSAYYLFILAFTLMSIRYHLKGYVSGSVGLAVFGWLVGSLGHDGGHYAVSRLPLINDIAVWGMSFLCNPVMWQHQHTYAHHSHTNDINLDPDLHHFTALLRVHRKIQREAIHGYQSNRAFVFFAYCFVVFGTCVKIPVGMITTGTLYGIVEWTDRGSPLKVLGLCAHYVLYLYVIMVGPFLSGRHWLAALTCVVLNLGLTGLLFAVFSQINHLNEDSLEIDLVGKDSAADRAHLEGSGKTGASTGNEAVVKGQELLRTSWAARQVVTSNNFASSSRLWHILSNGLNLQIEHHLFPSLNHCHLHLLRPVVLETCLEFGVPYKGYESWGELMDATMRWLDQLSEEDDHVVGKEICG